MVQRKRIGLLFSYDDQWIGGTYYMLNLIQAFRLVHENLQPEFVIFSNPIDYKRLQNESSYPYLSFELLDERQLKSWQKHFNSFSFHLFKIQFFKRLYKGYLDALFIFQQSAYLSSIPLNKRIYWIPDFQDKHLPHFFTPDGLKKKDEKSRWIANNAKYLILSSNAVLEDWTKFYPHTTCQTEVLHFAVTHPSYDHLSIETLLLKYNLPDLYFFSPNQFWAHKNHMVIIKAVEILKSKGLNIVIAFSGKENDNRNPGYAESLKNYVYDHHLSNEIYFLGFLDRSEQLQLMKHSRAIIQASRFEGWSTVIEDAMAMNQPVIASSLDVNKEQLGDTGFYFDVDSPEILANQILTLYSNKPELDYDYDKKVKQFADGFNAIIQKM